MLKRLIKKANVRILKKRGLNCADDIKIMGKVNWGSEIYLIKIGEKVTISRNVQFVNHDGGTVVFRNQEKYKEVIKFGIIEIGNNCFIGANSIIMPNVKIGNNSVIGAGSIVTKSLKGNAVYAGTPAKFIMSVDEYAKKAKENMIIYDREKFIKNKRSELENIFLKG
ncbi:DapH/DapD/GlmU-related protein [uncultured Clostridium sp.]|uniref:acyltransferase n=1 Tax=uncultured Clostridium sp. TaxID=59620 RepID=UPI00262CB5BC|nr:acyltransferase [uncultured Clostridium sp.]